MLVQGRIIEASVPDSQGRNRKRRPLIIVSATEEIESGAPFSCVAITSTLPTILSDDYVLLPYSNSGRHPRTGLSKRCAAVCNWAVQIVPQDVLEERGTVPTAKLQEIMARIDAMS